MNSAMIIGYSGTNRKSSYNTYKETYTANSTSPNTIQTIITITFVPFLFLAFLYVILMAFGKLFDVESSKKKQRELENIEKRKQIYKKQQKTNEKIYTEWHKQDKRDRIQTWKKRREEFNLLKHSTEFKIWRKEQYNCQNHQCAWCKEWILEKSEFTHVDHILPLFHGGTNDFSNMVLSCSTCNKRRKGSKVKGFNEDNIIFEELNDDFNTIPSWIKINKYAHPDSY